MLAKPSLLLPAFLVAASLLACQGTLETPIVVTNSPLAPESARPMVPEGVVPAQDLLDPNRVVVRVNAQIITVRSILAEIGEAIDAVQRGEGYDKRIRAQLKGYALRMVVKRLQLEAARKMGIEITDEELGQRVEVAEEIARERGTTLDQDLEARNIARWEWEDELRRKLLAEKYMGMTMGELPPVSPETRGMVDTRVTPLEIRSYYDRHGDEFRMQERARVQAIFIRFVDFEAGKHPGLDSRTWADRRARDLVARARRGESFDGLVAEVHGEPIGEFSKPFARGERGGDYAEKFAWSARVGDTSDPIELSSGRLILKLEEKTENRDLSFGEVKDEIARKLRILKRHAGQLMIQSQLLRVAVVEPRGYKEQLRRLFARETGKTLAELSR